MPELQQYLYHLQVTRLEMLTQGTTSEEDSILQQHSSYLHELTVNGVVFVAGRTQNNDESTFGIVIFEASDEEAARRIMCDDPAVKNGIMRAKLFPFQIAYRK